MSSYKFRNLSCSFIPKIEIWCIVGKCGRGSGFSVLEWCYNQGDAGYILSQMKQDPSLSDLKAKKWIPCSTPECPQCFKSDMVVSSAVCIRCGLPCFTPECSQCRRSDMVVTSKISGICLRCYTSFIPHS